MAIFGFLLRIVGLASHPSGFTPDEASFGYDAYSILRTGHDQWGKAFPLVFKSFGDDKLPVYAYLTVPTVAIFGLNEFSVRLPNAILGTLAILVVYLLVKELFRNEKLAIFSGFLLAVSPWHIMLSRGGFEANLTTFFLPLAILFFLRSIKDQRYLFLSVLVFLINIFTYHTARILSPLVLFYLIFAYRNDLLKTKKLNIWIVAGVVVALVSLVGFLYGGSRVASSGIFDINFADDRYFAQVVGEPSIVSKIFYNKPVYVARQFLTNYLSYFSPAYLFTSGPAEGTYGMLPGVGVLYIVEIVLLIGFIWKLIKDRSREICLLIFWILISAIPAALTKGPGYAANREAFVMPAIQIILAIGGFFIYEKLKTKKMRDYFVVGYSLLFIINFIYVGEKYLVGQVVNGSSSMIYGMNQLVSRLGSLDGSKVIVSKSISEPQIYLAFYMKMDPALYQSYSKNWQLINGWVDQQDTYSLGRYTFKSIDQIADFKEKNVLLVGKPQDFSPETKPFSYINYPNLKPAYYLFTTSQR